MITDGQAPRRRRSDSPEAHPWGAAARTERRLKTAQAVILLGLAVIVAAVAFLTGRGMVRELNDYRTEQNVQTRLDVLRYGLQETEAAYWRRRAAGGRGPTPQIVLDVLRASGEVRQIAADEPAPLTSPGERRAVADVIAGLDRLIALATAPQASAPLGSAADRWYVGQVTSVSRRLKDAATAWHSANAVQLTAANERVRSATGRLIVVTSVTALVALVLGLGAWALVARSRRRLVGALEQAAVMLRRQADSDPLTGLANHRVLHERLREDVAAARAEGRALSVVMLDLDHFKLINDTHGHPVGDVVLRETARRARLSARAHDLVARIGGEEFVLVLDDTDHTEAARIAERLRAAISAEEFPNGVGRVTASLGVATLRDRQDADALLARADAALYAAKARGRNVTVREEDVPEATRPGGDLGVWSQVYGDDPRGAGDSGWPSGETV